MTAIKKGDFIEIDYTGRIAETKEVFDTTLKEVADKEGIQMRKVFQPAIVCAGEGHLLPGLDSQVVGKELGSYTIELKDVDAFGKKNAKLLQLIPHKVFKEQQVNPVPGLEITVDNQTGIIRSVSGGRVIVDFNHPLASKDITYEITIKRIVTDAKEKITALLDIAHVPHGEVSVDGEKATVAQAQALPPQFIEIFTKDIVRLTGVADVTFTMPETKEKV